MRKKFSRNNNIDEQEYKTFAYTCAALNCNNKPISTLKVKYINKTGHFCQRCTEDLIQSELAVGISKGDVI
jgi:hypothetical protein